MRALPRHARTPIVALTANLPGHDRRAVEAGMNDVPSKPLDARQLVGTLLRQLARQV